MNEHDVVRRVSLAGQAEQIIRAGMDAVRPERLMQSLVRRRGDILSIGDKGFDLRAYERIYLIALGKAAPAMAGALLEILGEQIDEGLITGRPDVGKSLNPGGLRKEKHDADTYPGLEYIPASHPLPDENSLDAGRKAMELSGRAGASDLVFVLISGGGSAMLCLPAAGILLEEKRKITRDLLGAGASIGEINAVRKHLSAVKGGRLAAALHPATVVSLVISDVIGDDLESIASGPVYFDSTTFGTARGVLEKFHLWASAPDSVRKVIAGGMKGRIQETLKKNDPVFGRVATFIVGNNRIALEGAAVESGKLGFRTSILTSADCGEARYAAREYVLLLREFAGRQRAGSDPLCLLAGGELTVTVRGKGSGGRNTEFVLAALIELCQEPLRDEHDWLIASVGTDGIDGPTDAAGAMITPAALRTMERLSLDTATYLNANDSFSYFEKAGGLVRTGPTGTNVMDLRLFLLKWNPGTALGGSMDFSPPFG